MVSIYSSTRYMFKNKVKVVQLLIEATIIPYTYPKLGSICIRIIPFIQIIYIYMRIKVQSEI